MKVTFLGTTTLLFDDGTDQVLFDAHLTRPSLMRYICGKGETDAALVDALLNVHRVNRLRAVFISHSHHDHVMDAPYIANRCGAFIYGTPSTLNVARGGGVDEDRLKSFSGSETFTVGNYRVTVIPSLHSKPTLLNNDLGQTIDAPLHPPARLRDYKEGGSFDFLVEHCGRRFLIRPSFNYIEGQLDDITADVLFLGIAGLAKANAATEAAFFRETVEKVRPRLVIPLHWDNFFARLDRPVKSMPFFLERTNLALYRLTLACEARGVNCLVQLPRTSVAL